MAGALSVPFFDKIVNVLMAPLSPGQKLVYLTPGGAFNFILKVCMYVGIVGALPVIIFHLYRFLMPVVRKLHLRTALRYTLISIALAAAGILFAYFVSLPAALYFLTNFNLYHIDPMLTVDAYLSFVMTYLVAGAVLFQLPLVMTIIDSVKPLTPKRLMGYQRYVIVGSFIIAAIVTPTPDALNQTILASPIIVMYQLGIVIIASRHRKRGLVAEKELIEEQQPEAYVANNTTPAISPAIQHMSSAMVSVSPPRKPLITDMRPVSRTSHPLTRAVSNQRNDVSGRGHSPQARATAHLVVPGRSLDGIIMTKQA